MAESESKKPDRNEPRRAGDFVAKLVPDPAQPPDLMRLSGYRGASSKEGHVRLYGNPELSIYWDIPEGDVVHEQQVPADQDPLGAVTLWIKRSANVISNLSQQAQGGQQPMNPVGAAAPQAQNAIFTPTITIPQSLYFCPSPYYYCPPISPYCTYPTITHPTVTVTHTLPQVQAGAQQAAPQAFGGNLGAIGNIHFTPTAQPSIFIACPSHIIHCTIPHTLICPVSPYCPTIPTIPTIPTSIPTSIETGSLAAGGGGIADVAGGVAAAPQAASVQFGPVAGQVGQIQLQSPLVYCLRPSPYIWCYPSIVYWQCHPSPTPICYYQQVSPNFTPVTQTVTQSQPVTQSVATGSLVAGGAAAGGAAPQAFTFTPVTLPTNGTIQTFTPITHPTGGPTVGPTHPTVTLPTLPTITRPTITVTPVTFA